MKKARRDKPFGARWWPRGCPRPGEPAWDALPWPDRVPVLAAVDVRKDHWVPLDKPPWNLDGWLEAIFGCLDLTDKKALLLEHVAHIAVEVVLFQRTGRMLASWEYALEAGVTSDQVASAWNEAMALLGYEVTSPVKKKAGKKNGKKKPTATVAEVVAGDDEDYFDLEGWGHA